MECVTANVNDESRFGSNGLNLAFEPDRARSCCPGSMDGRFIEATLKNRQAREFCIGSRVENCAG
jgi:hypothetical protein